MTPGGLILLSWSIIFIFSACELGEMLSIEFGTLNKAFYQFDWYLLPPQTQRVFAMVLGNTQQPVIIGGYARTACLRATFKKVSFLFRNDIFRGK